MTANHRAKKDARARMSATGESYTTARRHTAQVRPAAKAIPRQFIPDHCANCLEPLPQQVERLFCSELCRQTAETVRYWRRIVRDGRIEQSDVKLALRTRVAHLLAGGYPEAARRLPAAVRAQIWERDRGLCRECGTPGAEIDHIAGDSPDLDNLQLLCAPCHHRKTQSRMAPATSDQIAIIHALERERVTLNEPKLLCDDQDPGQWATRERQLRKERRSRLLDELAELGYQRSDFPGYSWAEMWDEVLDNEADDYDVADSPEDYDGGYGPGSYFAHAMAKDD